MPTDTAHRDRFYRERDQRTNEYLQAHNEFRQPVFVRAGADACATRAGQLCLLTLANQIARAHREIRFELADPDGTLLVNSVCNQATLGAELQTLTSRIDPFGRFDVLQLTPDSNELSIVVGDSALLGTRWYLGYERSNGEIAEAPCALGTEVLADLRGAGVAAILGAATAMKESLGMKVVPTVLSAWNFDSGSAADRGPIDLQTVDVGRGLIIGAGAVSASAVYWLIQWGNKTSWTIIDGDTVALHNTNRCLLFFPRDAGWFGGSVTAKAECLAGYLANSTPICTWYDCARLKSSVFDTVVVLANEREVRTLVSHRNDPIQFQATTSESWGSQLHRHIVGRDDCVRCRMSDVRAPRFNCGTGPIATQEGRHSTDAALPFLSAASGLLVTSALERLQRGEVGNSDINTWRWDFSSTHRIAQDGRHTCKDHCSTLLPPKARREIHQETRWFGQPWLVV